MIWRVKITPWRRRFCQLAPLTRRTAETGFGLWGTPLAQHANGTPEAFLERKRKSVAKTGRSMGIVLSDLQMQAKALWPTPQARDHFPAHNPEYIAAKKAQGHGMSNLNDNVMELWPTPTAITDTGGAALCKWGGTRSREKLRQAVTSQELNGALNPAFPCWLMGYPTEWNDCAPLEMPSSRKSRRSS